MRRAALGVDFEMHGKDLKPSAELSAKICKTIGGNKPELFVYELFLDHEGKKISKSKGIYFFADRPAAFLVYRFKVIKNGEKKIALVFCCVKTSV